MRVFKSCCSQGSADLLLFKVDFPERMSAALLLKLMVTTARFEPSALLSFQLSFIGLLVWNRFVVRYGLEAEDSYETELFRSSSTRSDFALFEKRHVLRVLL